MFARGHHLNICARLMHIPSTAPTYLKQQCSFKHRAGAHGTRGIFVSNTNPLLSSTTIQTRRHHRPRHISGHIASFPTCLYRHHHVSTTGNERDSHRLPSSFALHPQHHICQDRCHSDLWTGTLLRLLLLLSLSVALCLALTPSPQNVSCESTHGNLHFTFLTNHHTPS